MIERRRALMMAGSVGDTVIDGSKLTWVVGLLKAATGLLDTSYTTYISTNNYIRVKSTDAIISYTGPSADSNQVDYIVKIAEYSENYTFLGISNILSVGNESTPLRFKSTCKFIKISFGHGTGTGVNMNVQDGSLFTASIVPVQSGRLPSTFQEVVWVGTNGQQTRENAVIDIEYAPTEKPKAEFLLQQNATGSKCVFGLDTSDSAPHFMLYTASGNFYYKWGNSNSTIGMNSYSTSKWYEISAGISLVVDGSTQVTKPATDWSGNTKTVKLFYGAHVNIQCRIGEFKLYDDTNLVRDLVPCYRLSDNRIGFYDIVGNNFYTNAGAANVLTFGGAVI